MTGAPVSARDESMNLRTTVRGHRLATTVVAALAPLATAALLSLVRDSVTPATAVLVLVAVVVAACATGIRAAGLVALPRSPIRVSSTP